MARGVRHGGGGDPVAEWLLGLPDEIQAAADRGQPIVLELDEPPAEHVVALMAALGVPIVAARARRNGGTAVTSLQVETANCRVEGCPEEARSTRGTYAYLCERHIAAKRKTLGLDEKRPAPAAAATNGFAAKVKELGKLGRGVDRAKAKATTAAQRALALKADADRLEAEFRRRTRELMGGE